MNRRRSDEAPSNKVAIFALILMAVLATSGGAMHAIYRTGQIQTEREIAQVRNRMDEHRLDIQMVEVRTERLLDRYEIRTQLKDSSLVEFDYSVVEEVQPPAEEVLMPVAARP